MAYPPGHSGELFARVDTPSQVFVKGYVGAGAITDGKQTDEDWSLLDGSSPPKAVTAYEVTGSTASGSLQYAAADVGFNVLHDRDYKVGPFVGYSYFHQTIVPTASLRDGVVFYACDTTAAVPNPSCSTSPTAQGVSGTTYTANFPSPYGGFGLTPQQLTAMDLAGINAPGSGVTQPYTGSVGPNPVMLKYFNSYPLPNDFSQGDGVNTAGYRFAAPTTNTKNWYIAKLDYNITKDSKQRVSLTGALANQDQANAPFLPGNAPESSIVNFNKGLIANYSAVLTSSLINNFRYGYVRESIGTIGNSDQAWNFIRGIDQGVNYSSQFQRPINSFWDDLTWTKGKHSFQFGFQISLIRNPTSSTTGSFSSGYMNAQWLNTSGLAGRDSSPLNPVNGGFPAVDFAGFGTNYDNAVTALLGMDVEVNAQYNYNRDGSTLAQGAPVVRHFAEDGYETYAQDTWKVKPNLTLTLGLRYSLFSPPWETNGLEVTPTEGLNTWFNGRGVGMNNGVPSIDAPLVAFNWSGPANGGTTGYYGWDYKNLGPRVALAWSPSYDSGLLGDVFGGAGKSSVRAGFGIVYDRIGEGLLDTFDSNGAFGLRLTSPMPPLRKLPPVLPASLVSTSFLLQTIVARLFSFPLRLLAIPSHTPATQHLAAKPLLGVWIVI